MSNFTAGSDIQESMMTSIREIRANVHPNGASDAAVACFARIKKRPPK